MKIEEPDLSGRYTYADYLTWQWTEMAELIHGKIFKMSPAPGSKHQKVGGNLFGILWNHLRDKKCQVFMAPFDVRLPVSSKQKSDKEIITVVQPDLCVVCDPAKIDERGCLGAPDWIIEILSRHTSSKDLREKFEVYEKA
jgi:Uma2 family endonuclease